jgi:hypothetical protein
MVDCVMSGGVKMLKMRRSIVIHRYIKSVCLALNQCLLQAPKICRSLQLCGESCAPKIPPPLAQMLNKMFTSLRGKVVAIRMLLRLI